MPAVKEFDREEWNSGGSTVASSILKDKFWVDTAAFVAGQGSRAKDVIAPAEFCLLYPDAISYERKAECVSPDVLVIHKGLLSLLGKAWIENAISRLHPSYANAVFVVFTKFPPAKSLFGSAHFISFQKNLSLLPHVVTEQRPPPVYLGGHHALTKTIYGHKIYVDTRDVSVAPHLLMDGYWEQWVTNVFRQIVKPGMSVVDIGANMGYYSVLAADLVGCTGSVIAFEPNPALAEMLHWTLSINGFLDRSKVENKAVYSCSQRLQFGIYERFLGSSSIFASAEAAKIWRDEVHMVEVEAVSLDDYLSPGHKLDVIKIDAEGAEPAIVKGAMRLLAENEKLQIIMEFAPARCAPSYGSPAEFYRELRRIGFRVYRIQSDASLQERSAEDLSQVAGHCDLLLRRE